MGTTPKYGLPYPELTDVPNVPSDMRVLAEAVETHLSHAQAGQTSSSGDAGATPTGGWVPLKGSHPTFTADVAGTLVVWASFDFTTEDGQTGIGEIHLAPPGAAKDDLSHKVGQQALHSGKGRGTVPTMAIKTMTSGEAVDIKLRVMRTGGTSNVNVRSQTQVVWQFLPLD